MNFLSMVHIALDVFVGRQNIEVIKIGYVKHLRILLLIFHASHLVLGFTIDRVDEAA